jgi:hypothetical protein
MRRIEVYGGERRTWREGTAHGAAAIVVAGEDGSGGGNSIE